MTESQFLDAIAVTLFFAGLALIFVGLILRIVSVGIK